MLNRLLASLVEGQRDFRDYVQRQDQYLKKKSDADRDKRFNLARQIPKISANMGSEFLEEMENFE